MNLYTYKFEVTRVLDGDTVDGRIDLGFKIGMDTRVRLLGYDAPETWRPKSDAERVAGKKVAAYLSKILYDKEVFLRSHVIDLYNRSIGELFISGESVNKMVMDFIEENGLQKEQFRL